MSSSVDLADQFRTIAELRGEIAWIVDCGTAVPSYISPSALALLGYDPCRIPPPARARRRRPAGALCGGLDERLRRFADGDAAACAWCASSTLRTAGRRTGPGRSDLELLLDDAGAPHSLVGTHPRPQRRSATAQAGSAASPACSTTNSARRCRPSTAPSSASKSTGAECRRAPPASATARSPTAVDRLIAMLDDYLSPDRIDAIGHKRQDRARRAAPPARGRRAPSRARPAARAGIDAARAAGPDPLRAAMACGWR